MRLFGLGLALLTLPLPSLASAEGQLPVAVKAIDAASTTMLTADADSCAATRWTAPADGVLTAHLRGAAGDWSLAASDASGRRLAASDAFRANELVQVGVRRGRAVTLEACRKSGAAAALLRTQFARVDLDAVRGLIKTTRLVRVTVPSRTAFQRLQDSGLDVTHDAGLGYARVVAYGAADLATLRSLGLPFRVEIGDLAARLRKTRAADAALADVAGLSALPSGRTDYRTYEDVQAELQQMLTQYPELVQPIAVQTKSFQGRDIQVIEIAENVTDGDDGRPVFFLGAVHHAREWPAMETAMEFAWELLKNPKDDPRIAQILREVRVVVMPLTNPDGFISSRTAVDPDGGALTAVFPTGGSFAYRRKNCNPLVIPSGALPCDLTVGVDNNRNYVTEWGGPGASTTPTDQSYRGLGPNSEPETRAVIEVNSRLNAPVHISAHNVAAKVLRPPGLEAAGFAPDETALKALGKLMADPTGYANEYGWQLYDTTGTTKDWGYDALGQYSYTVEVGPKGGDFHGPYKTHVIDEYDGRVVGGKKKGGLREAYINAALYTRNETQTSRLTGSAPAGATLRITKDFLSKTYPVCTVASPLPINTIPQLDYCVAPGEVQEVPEHVEVTMQVGDTGQYTWWLNPSTRPFATAPEAYTLTCEVGGQVVKTQSVIVARGQTLPVDACGA